MFWIWMAVSLQKSCWLPAVSYLTAALNYCLQPKCDFFHLLLIFCFVFMVLLQKYCPMRNQATLREEGILGLYLMLAVLHELILKILGPKQWNYRILMGECKESGYGKCAGHQQESSHWGLGIRVGYAGAVGDLCHEVCLQKEIEKGRNGWLSLHGAF
jgi:hypothetical protein